MEQYQTIAQIKAEYGRRAADMHVEAEVRGYDKDKREVELAFASETPVPRWYGREVLSLDPKHIDLARLRNKAPLLLQHDPDKQIGVLTSAVVGSDKVARAVAKLSRKRFVQDDVIPDLEDGILSKTSVGYELIDAIADATDPDTKERTITWSWRPMEVSLVSIPADDTVGVGRSATNQPEAPAQPVTPVGVRAMTEPTKTEPGAQATAPAPTIDIAKVRKEETERVQGILALGPKHGLAPEADAAVKNGTSLADFRAVVLEKIGSGPTPAVNSAQKPGTEIGLNAKERKHYSLRNAILSQIPNSGVAAGFERELSSEVAKITGRTPQGIFIPHDILRGVGAGMFKRAGELGVGGSFGTGANIVAEDLLSGSFIDLLRNQLSVMQAGATMLSGLVGDIAIPKQTGPHTAQWPGENTAADRSRVTLTQVPGKPKTLTANTAITRKLLVQASLDVEAMVRNDLASQIRLGIDLAALHGAGGTDEPRGITTAGSGATEVTLGATLYGTLIDMIASIKSDNADISELAFLVNANAWAALASTPVIASTDSRMILDPNSDRLLGRSKVDTNQVRNGTLILGAFAQMIVALWSGLDIIVDPYTESTTGAIRVTALQDADVLLRYGECFAFADGIGET